MGDGISYFFTFKFFICTLFSIYITISISVMHMYTIVLVHYCAPGSIDNRQLFASEEATRAV